MSTSDQGLAIAQIAFYAAISIPALYCLISHGRHGLMGWIYVLAMCGLRLAGNAMSLNAYHNHEISPSASIINGIGLSPLLMASLGLLHESNHSIQHTLSPLLGMPGKVVTHLVVAGGIALAAASHGKESLLRGGLIIFALGWTMVAGLVFLSYRGGHSRRVLDEKKLLLAITVAMPLIGIRIIYSIATVFSSSGMSGGSLAVRVILGVLPEFLVMIDYVAVGIVTRNLARDRSEQKTVNGA
ncbi:hypothetical protein ASPWEDRAFT_32921 [Aspergillus wentii DTO 134E9]|uniref:DUF7702 domain-containing protein n=1 Tax=Aspergillus wentii DTO 134E9 TaxID=1073089 RepID=A0A1L9R425_ASPWE|nr:uncharacterized protein ASPWEDRAFT_32921 [Aspergillus wentii DTO 134E9]KAI9926963.1 hypothetical protein MW887_003343 [Aspergillus wentii]OJJ29679.1 hypothetical protein ASPWEDRAFT_32921 [Aspergillus wentii DTO 134E9]